MREYIQIIGQKTSKEEKLGWPGRRWDGNIKMDLKETGCEGVDWITLVHDSNQWRAFVNKG